MKEIKVSVIIFPNGQTLWIKYLKEKDISKIADKWYSLNKKYKDTNATIAIATIFMLEKDYNNIPATNQSHELTKDLVK